MSNLHMRTSFLRLLLFLLVIGFSAAISLDYALADDTTGSISGRVTRNSDGTGILNIYIWVYDSNWNSVSVSPTDASGSYSITGLAAGSYYIEARNNQGFITEYYDNVTHVYYYPDTEKNFATAVNVTAGNTTTEINFSLAASGSITGRVTNDSDGAGTRNIYIVVYDKSWNIFPAAFQIDDSGNYSITGLVAGSYYLKTDSANYVFIDEYYDSAASQNSAKIVEVTEGNTTTGINFGLTASGGISGRRSRDSDGASIFCLIDIFDSNWTRQTTAHIDYDTGNGTGRYTIIGLAPGSYYLMTENNQGYIDEYYNNTTSKNSATPINITAGITLTEVNFSLAAGGGSITGRVTKEINGSSITNGQIEVYDSNWNYVKSATIEGNYIITGLLTGSYYLKTVTLPTYYIDEYYNNVTSKSSAVAVSVTEGQTTTGINFSLAGTGSIVGRVTSDADGVGIPGITVQMNDGYYRTTSTTTDASGYYSFTGLLPNNTYVLGTFNNLGFIDEYYDNVSSKNSATVITAISGSPVTANFSLAVGGDITGQITRTLDGTGISGVTVNAYVSCSGLVIRSAITDASGNYSITGLATGSYCLKTSNNFYFIDKWYDNAAGSSSAASVGVVAGSATTGIDFRLSRQGSISGRVTRDLDGAGIPNVNVSYYYSDFHAVRSTTTDANGNYMLAGLSAYTYYIGTSNSLGYTDEYYNGKLSQSAADPIIVSNDVDTANINFSLSLSGNITGRVTQCFDGAPISGVYVMAYDMAWNSVKSARSDASGNYSITGLPSGRYYLQGNPSSYGSKYHNDATTQRLAMAVVVSPGETTSGIDFSLSLGGTISGRVVSASNGSGLSGVFIYAYNSSSASSGGLLADMATSTDFDGYFSMSGLAPGKYYVRTNRASGYGDLYYGGQASMSTANLVVITSNEVVSNINFSLPAGGTILGKVTRETDGAGISGIYVYRYDSNVEGSAYIEITTADSAGNYVFSSLAPGNYYLRVAGSTYIAKYYGNANSLSSATPIAITEGARVTDVDFVVTRGSSIVGKVLRASDEAGLSGIKVIAHDADWTHSGFARTNAVGYYSINGLEPGTYFLKTSNSSGWQDAYYDSANGLSSATSINLIAGQDVTNKNFKLNKAKPVSADIDGDGKPDILWRNRSTGDMSAWLMDKAAQTGNGLFPSNPDQNMKIAGLADFNGDGKQDILWRNKSNGDNIIWYMEGASKTGEAPLEKVADLNWQIVGVGDFNDDGSSDIVWRNTSTGYSLVWFMNKTLHTDGAWIEALPDINWTIAGIGDFNGDAKPDILWRNKATGENYVRYMNGTSMIGGASVDSVADLNWEIVAVGDYDGDGKSDILWRNTSTGDNVIWFMNGVTISSTSLFDKVADSNWLMFDKDEEKYKVTADFNGDGNADIVWRNTSSGQNVIWYLSVNTSIGADVIDAVSDVNWKIAALADFNNDGKVDILWRNYSTGMNYVWYMDGKNSSGGAFIDTVSDLNWKIVGDADFNSDGKPDVLWRNASTGVNYVWFMDGTVHLSGLFVDAVSDLNWMVVGVGDFNSDGKPDILWRNSTTGQNYVWYMDGTNHTGGDFLDMVEDSNWKIVALADYNKDGKVDILWRNETTGQNYVWYMNGSAHIGGDFLNAVTDTAWKVAGGGCD